MRVQDSSFIAITRQIILRILLRQCRDLALIQSGTNFILPNGKSRMMCVQDSSFIAITRRIICEFCFVRVAIWLLFRAGKNILLPNGNRV